ncbi:MAG: redoxin domain-containing protein [Proteobacteria bacterium]|nr:redoxin domain-containing protein [Pseudomonadota bacterium]
MKFLASLTTALAAMTGLWTTHPKVAQGSDNRTAWDFSFTSIDGDPMPLSQYKGKVLLVVNTASQCGFTPQYDGLQALWDKYRDQGLVVVGVPSDAFNQELNTAAEVKGFCETKFHITFPMTDITAVTGDTAHPFYKWIHAKLDSQPRWNFFKYLIGRDGQPIARFTNFHTPDSKTLADAVEEALRQKSG